MRCPQRVLGLLTADPSAEPWRDLAPYPLRSALDGATPQQATTVKSTWTPTEWRLLFEVADTHVHATLTERGAPLYKEEVVEVFLDPVGDLEAYFEIEVNPLNATLEVVLRRNRSGYKQDFSWRCEDLRTAIRRTDTGWCAELSIPFTSVTNAPPTAGQRWRVNFCRIDRPPNTERELTAWSPPLRATFHTPERFGHLEFTA